MQVIYRHTFLLQIGITYVCTAGISRIEPKILKKANVDYSQKKKQKQMNKQKNKQSPENLCLFALHRT